MGTEVWAQIKGYEGLYWISNFGRVMRKKKILSNAVANGYYFVHLCKDGFVAKKYVHRLVAEAFVPNLDKKPEVNHIDGNKKNNNTDNLEWCTQQENVKHAYTILRRSLSGSCKKKIKTVCVDEQNRTKVFESINEASRQIGISLSKVYWAIKTKKRINGFLIETKE